MKNFKGEVYEFTKKISNSTLKKEYDNIISTFSVDSGTKSIYNQMTIAKGHQFLSFFITEKYKEEAYEKLKMIIPLLDENEKRCFGRCHSYLKYLNKELCQNLILKHEGLKPVLDPYSNILIIPDEENIEDIKKEIDISLLIDSFKDTVAYKNIINYNEVDISKIPAKQFSEFFALINKEIKELEIENSVSRDTENIIMQINNPNNKGLIKFMFSVVSIRYMMMYMNQLIYQKFEDNKLPMIDENNLITYSNHSNLLGEGIIALTQPSPLEYLIEPGDLILFSGLREKNQLCEIEGTTLNFQREEGSTKRYKLRNINNELNPLYNVIR